MKPDARDLKTYPCRDCPGTMTPNGYMTPAGPRYACGTCQTSAPRQTVGRWVGRKGMTFKRPQHAAA